MRDPSLWPLRFYFGAPPWIFYGPSHRKLRRYRGRVRLRVRGIGPRVALADGQPWHVSLINMLIEAGVLMTPAVDTWKSSDPWQPGAWYPVLRYGGSFAVDNPLLTLLDHAKNVDTRLQAVLSEELAVGFCGHVLRRAFGVAHIADAAPLIGKNLTWGAPGNRKRPDFLGRKPDQSPR